jgi:hypothetical protein
VAAVAAGVYDEGAAGLAVGEMAVGVAAEDEVNVGKSGEPAVYVCAAVGETDDEIGLVAQLGRESPGDRDGILEDVVGDAGPDGSGGGDLWSEADDGEAAGGPVKDDVILDDGWARLTCGDEVRGEDWEGGIAELALEEAAAGVGLAVAHSHRVVADGGHLAEDGLSEEAEGEVAGGDGIAGVEEDGSRVVLLEARELARGGRGEAVVEIGGVEDEGRTFGRAGIRRARATR